MPRWPLPRLTNNEREARLRFFLGRSKLKLRQRANDVDEKKCLDLLDRLGALRDVEVLRPKDFGEVTEAGRHHRDARRVLDTSPYVQNCPNLDLERTYWNSNVLLDEPAFLAKPQAEKEAIAERYFEATRNTEIYDLSKYLGDGSWGYFAEGLVVRKRADDEYAQCHNTFFSASVISKVFNSKTCAYTPTPVMKVYRFRHLSRGSGAQVVYQPTTPSFYALVEASGTLYRIAYESRDDMNEFASLVSPDQAELFIDTISNTGTTSAKDHHTCYFSSAQMGE